MTTQRIHNVRKRLSEIALKMATKPLELLLIRDVFLPTRTLGILYLDGVKECYICEDRYRGNDPKVHGQTAIPQGRYEIIINMSPRFKRELPLLLNVPNFEGIRIHSGNHEGHTEGCLLPGRTRNATGVFQSVVATNNLNLKIQHAIWNGRKVFITIKNEPNA
jgi:hypothetical protein